MHYWGLAALAAALPDGLPESVDVPSYFLQGIDTPVWLWTFRILLAAALGVVLWGCWYYTRHPAAQARKDADGRRAPRQRREGKK